MSTQSVNLTFTLTPTLATTPTYLTINNSIGYGLNGIKFDPMTGGLCLSTATGVKSGCDYAGGNSGTWNMEAVNPGPPTISSGWVFDFGTDNSNAHIQPGGSYHYHAMPTGLIDTLTSNFSAGKTMVLVGWAIDGFPIYARYGYTKATDSTSALKVMTSSWSTKSTPDSGRPSISNFPMGSFKQDWQYVAGSGDLDACNGRFDVTPEFPNGIYHYYVTDTYPYFQRCESGTAQTISFTAGSPSAGSSPPSGSTSTNSTGSTGSTGSNSMPTMGSTTGSSTGSSTGSGSTSCPPPMGGTSGSTSGTSSTGSTSSSGGTSSSSCPPPPSGTSGTGTSSKV